MFAKLVTETPVGEFKREERLVGVAPNPKSCQNRLVAQNSKCKSCEFYATHLLFTEGNGNCHVSAILFPRKGEHLKSKKRRARERTGEPSSSGPPPLLLPCNELFSDGVPVLGGGGLSPANMTSGTDRYPAEGALFPKQRNSISLSLCFFSLSLPLSLPLPALSPAPSPSFLPLPLFFSHPPSIYLSISLYFIYMYICIYIYVCVSVCVCVCVCVYFQ